MKPDQRVRLIRWLVFFLVIGIMVALFYFRDQIRNLGAYGYPGIFLISIAANATVLIPLPGVMIATALGAVFNPFWVAIASGLGASLGEFSGYLLGFSGGRAVLERTSWHTKVENWIQKYGDITILVLAFIPNPLFDMAGISAGALKMPIWRFLLWTAIGKIGKMMLFAYGGSGLFRIFTKFGW